jgi:hypothetical protein
LNGFATPGPVDQAFSTVSRKPSTLGQKASNRKRRQALASVARLISKGQWSEVEEPIAERKEEGKKHLPIHRGEDPIEALEGGLLPRPLR